MVHLLHINEKYSIDDLKKGLKRVRKQIWNEKKNRMGINQSQFAKKIGVSLETVRNWEQGKRRPSLEQMEIICNTVNCDIDYLFGKIETLTHDTAFICDKTGLSEKAVQILTAAKNVDDYNGSFSEPVIKYSDIVSLFISSVNIFEIEKAVENYQVFKMYQLDGIKKDEDYEDVKHQKELGLIANRGILQREFNNFIDILLNQDSAPIEK